MMIFSKKDILGEISVVLNFRTTASDGQTDKVVKKSGGMNAGL